MSCASSVTALPAAPLVEALEASEEGASPGLGLLRVARLYGLLGQEKRAVRALRRALGAGGLSLTLGLVLAEGVASAAPALALGLLDWLAKALTIRDDRSADHPTLDPVRRDPLAMCALLERAAEVALTIGQPSRAVVLLRTAASRYERMGQTRAAFRAQARGAEAMGQ